MNNIDDIVTEAEYISDSILVESTQNGHETRVGEGVDRQMLIDDLLLEKGDDSYQNRMQRLDSRMKRLNNHEKTLKRAALLGAGTYLTSAGMNKHISNKKAPLMEEARRYQSLANSAKHRKDKEKYLKKLREIKKKIDRLNAVEKALDGGKTLGVQATLAGVGGQLIIDARKNSIQKKKGKNRDILKNHGKAIAAMKNVYSKH